MGEPASDGRLISSDKSSGWLIPDEILIDITSRLPVKDVIRWRCVSRKWEDITTTLDFIRLHMSRYSNPAILVYDEDDVMSDSMRLLDNWWDPLSQPQIHRLSAANFPEYDFTFSTPLSHDGLLVLKNKSGFMVLNPLFNRQQVIKIIFRPETRNYISVFGMFWHPNLKEYCIIFIVFIRDILGRKKDTYIVNLGSNPLCRKVVSPWDQRIAFDGLHYDPVLLGNCLYKEVNLRDGNDCKRILEFDIMTEESKLISPPRELKWIECYDSLNLVNIDGQLSCVRISEKTDDLIIRISIWTLRDHGDVGSQAWIFCNYNITCQVCPVQKMLFRRAISFVDGKLVVTDEGLYICDLKMGTSKFFDRNNSSYLKLGSTNIWDIIKSKSSRFPIGHVMSLASLAKCKSEIKLDIGPLR